MKTIANPAVLRALEARLGLLQPEGQRRWGTLSAHEMLTHLADASTLILTPPGRGPGARWRLPIKWFSLYLPLRWPRGVRTLAAVDPHRDGTPPEVFETDRQRVVEGLRAMAAAKEGELLPAHFLFGPMSLRDWHRMAYRHTYHHLKQFGL